MSHFSGSNQKIEELAQFAAALFPKLDRQEKVMALKLYALLSEGRAVSARHFASRLGFSLERVFDFLSNWPGVDFDDEGQVVGFWGLSLTETRHRFEVEGKCLYTWCAWDTLFIPQLLRQTAEVYSNCPVTQTEIHLTVTPKEIRDLKPDKIFVSFIAPKASKVQENVAHHFCRYVHFFAHSDAAQKWVSRHPGTFVLSITEAFQLGQLKNQIRFSGILS